MDLLKQKILSEGEVYEGNILKVDSFLNHQIDCVFLAEVAKEFHRLFENEGVNKVLTIEASGIAIGALVAREFECPLVFAKKSKTKNNDGNVLTSTVESFTHGVTNNVLVSKKYLSKGDKVLIIDDFLAMGNALRGLIDIVNQSGAELAGCGIVIEKGYQHGGDMLREKGIKVESLAIVESMNHENGEITFR
ncbi:MAG: xanthine phosphoribosyltransferase [Eubacterium sp.]|nr:xanthine phosphoribosyltransferase [Eubacterium sp.]MBR4241203.1 xanthine phosphoribosyltransferase [Eubacterium sp.]